MDRNALLAFALSLLVLSVWMTLEAKNRAARQAAAPPPATAPAVPGPEVAPAPPAAGAEETARAAAVPAVPAPGAVPAPPAAGEALPEERVVVETELFRAELSSHGGGIARWELQEYSEDSDEGGEPIELSFRGEGDPLVLATPFEELGLGDLSRAPFRVVERSAERVVFEYAAGGIVVRKSFRFEPGTYLFRIELEVSNGSPARVEPAFGMLWPVEQRDAADYRETALVALHEGELERIALAGFGRSGGFGGLFGGTPEPEKTFAGEVEWAGADTRYFLSVVIPDVPRDARAHFVAVEPGERALALLDARPVGLPPGRTLAREMRVYMGPKEPPRLEAVGADLDRSINLGWAIIAPITRAFLWLLHALYAVIPNYGVAIILITVLVRGVTWPLASKQMKSMKRMGELQPRIRELQKKYADDRQRQSQEMMKLYRETGVNPLGGCLPMLLQVPVFIALYYALQSSIDLRQAPFVGWIDDLAQPETLFVIPGLDLPVRVLPLLMGASMAIQQRLTPSTMDPAQARMMMTIMPVMFTVLFYTFPSGLVLYWLVSNLLAIAQQVILNRSADGPAAAGAARANQGDDAGGGRRAGKE